jgi:UDPglucose 6-dehydrogenase
VTEYVEEAARSIAEHAPASAVVVQKSTVPPGMAKRVAEILRESGRSLQVLSNPEFLAEGTAIRDLQAPDRVVIGHEQSPAGEEAAAKLAWIYEHWTPAERILTMDQTSAEICKLAANSFLAQRLSSVNAFAHICECLGGDAPRMLRAVGADHRIGPNFLAPSIAFGGSCF